MNRGISMSKINSIKALVLGFLSLQLISCSDISVGPNNNAKYLSVASKVNFCTTEASTIRSKLKFIFIVDRSGSNNQRRDPVTGELLPGTDLDGNRRFSSLYQFVSTYGQQQNTDLENVYWSMINFGSSATVARSFVNEEAQFASFVEDQWTRTQQIDSGGTNYIRALDLAYDMINNDIRDAKREVDQNNAEPVASNYVIFFVSDGSPVVDGELQDSFDISERVENIAEFDERDRLYVDSVQINTAYYFENPVSQEARDLLSEMSIDGNGDFLEVGLGQNIEYGRFTPPVKINRFALKEIWVQNANTVWVDDRLYADRDADGLADFQELALGSNPDLYDSDGNGVGDGVEYRLAGQPCFDSQCTVANANPYTQCRAFQVQNQPYTYLDSDRDYLNDCEERLLGTFHNNPDSNGDYVPDQLAFVKQIQMTIGQNDLYIDADRIGGRDGYNVYEELKYNTPIDANNSLVPNLRYQNISVKRVSQSPVQDCYDISVTDVAYTLLTDKIRVFIFENTQTLDQKIIFSAGEQQLNPNGSVNISNAQLSR